MTPRPFFSPVLALAMTALLGVEMTELARAQAELDQRCGALAHAAALALQARGRPCDVAALRKLIEADAMALASAGPLMSEALTDLEAAVAKWITAGCVSVVHRTWAAAPPSGVADPASVHAIELRFNEPGNWVGALVSCTGGLTILEWPAATAPEATAAVTRGAEVFTRARQESPRFLDAMREAWAAVPGGRAPNESLRERAGIGFDDIVRQEAAQSPVTKATIEAWCAEVSQRRTPTLAEVRAEQQVHFVHPRVMEALQAECASGKHTYDLFESRCMVCGVELMMEVDLAACEGKYLGEPGTVRYVGVDPASPPTTATDAGGTKVYADLAGSIDLSAFRPGQKVVISDAEGRTVGHAVVESDRQLSVSSSRPAIGVAGLLREQVLSGGEAREAFIGRSLHPTGRCTCFGEGRCAWCEMNRRRELREARRPRRQPCTCTPDATCGACYQRGYDDANPQERQVERARKRKVHQRKQVRRRRRGY